MKELHYYANYANSHDIDCFFKVGMTAYHFASNGNPIPEFITRKRNIKIQDAVYEILSIPHNPSTFRIKVHRDTIKKIINKELDGLTVQKDIFSVDKRENIDQIIDDYKVSFEEMASVGFVSMDMDEAGRMNIIAEPMEGNVPDYIFEILPEGTVL